MTLVDSNVLIDVLSRNATWLAWSAAMLSRCAEDGPLLLNAVVYAEIAAGLDSQETLDAFIADTDLTMDHIPRSALFLAGQAFRRYRRAGGLRTSVLPDFFIGAHAQVASVPILTRDPRRYRAYFPDVEVIAPDVEM